MSSNSFNNFEVEEERILQEQIQKVIATLENPAPQSLLQDDGAASHPFVVANTSEDSGKLPTDRQKLVNSSQLNLNEQELEIIFKTVIKRAQEQIIQSNENLKPHVESTPRSWSTDSELVAVVTDENKLDCSASPKPLETITLVTITSEKIDEDVTPNNAEELQKATSSNGLVLDDDELEIIFEGAIKRAGAVNIKREQDKNRDFHPDYKPVEEGGRKMMKFSGKQRILSKKTHPVTTSNLFTKETTRKKEKRRKISETMSTKRSTQSSRTTLITKEHNQMEFSHNWTTQFGFNGASLNGQIGLLNDSAGNFYCGCGYPNCEASFPFWKEWFVHMLCDHRCNTAFGAITCMICFKGFGSVMEHFQHSHNI